MNSKTRKLKFIRKKNAIRRGLPVIAYMKVDSELAESETFDLQGCLRQLEGRATAYVKTFRLTFNMKELRHETGRTGDDFIRNLHTVKLYAIPEYLCQTEK